MVKVVLDAKEWISILSSFGSLIEDVEINATENELDYLVGHSTHAVRYNKIYGDAIKNTGRIAFTDLKNTMAFLKKSKGDIINVSSEAVRFYPPLLSVYTASKSALEAFSQSLRVELAPSGVRVAALRVGHLLREDPSPLDDETYELMIKTFEETGFMASTGEGMQLDTVTSAAIHLLTLPSDATIDLLEIRSRH